MKDFTYYTLKDRKTNNTLDLNLFGVYKTKKEALEEERLYDEGEMQVVKLKIIVVKEY